MTESLILFCLAGIVFVILLSVSGAIAGFAIIKTTQKAAPHLTRSDVAAVTRAWALACGLGGALGVIFLGISGSMFAGYLTNPVYFTIVFAITGISVGLLGVGSIFQRLAR